ncbi:hypothetical protein HDU84_005395 [Entophlyctis sp. JEL0112]|nr:hypothetical protein HDU84_005395 [Entophlyctis sp. JEL0112]
MDDTIVANFFVLANIVAFLTAANVLMLILLLCFLWHTNNKLSLPMNWKLVAFSVSLVGIFATENVLIRKALIPEDSLEIPFHWGFLLNSSLLPIKDVQYSWLRGHGVVAIMFPKVHKYLNWLVKVYPYVCYLQVFWVAISAIFVTFFPDNTAPLAPLDIAADSSIAVTGVICVIFDTALLIAFVTFLRTTHAELVDETDWRFATIARFGIAANACAYAAFALFVAGAAMDNPFNEEVIWNVSYCCLVGMFVALAAMKVSLHRRDVIDAVSTAEHNARNTKRRAPPPPETAGAAARRTLE